MGHSKIGLTLGTILPLSGYIYAALLLSFCISQCGVHRYRVEYFAPSLKNYMLRLCIIAAAVAAISATGIDCSPGEVWVENKIKFQCYTEGEVVWGINPVGKIHSLELISENDSTLRFHFSLRS